MLRNVNRHSSFARGCPEMASPANTNTTSDSRPVVYATYAPSWFVDSQNFSASRYKRKLELVGNIFGHRRGGVGGGDIASSQIQ